MEQMYRQLKKCQLEERIVRFEETLAERRIVARRSQVKQELFAQYRRSKCDDEKKIVEQDLEKELYRRTPQKLCHEPTVGEIDVYSRK